MTRGFLLNAHMHVEETVLLYTKVSSYMYNWKCFYNKLGDE